MKPSMKLSFISSVLYLIIINFVVPIFSAQTCKHPYYNYYQGYCSGSKYCCSSYAYYAKYYRYCCYTYYYYYYSYYSYYSGSSASGGAIAGAVIGSIVGFVVLCIIITVICKACNKTSSRGTTVSAAPPQQTITTIHTAPQPQPAQPYNNNPNAFPPQPQVYTGGPSSSQPGYIDTVHLEK